MVNMGEVLIVNGIGVFLLLRLLFTRAAGKEGHFRWEQLFTAMILLTILGLTSEAMSFLIDGARFPGSRVLNILLNTLCFLSSSTLGYLWCLFAEFRIFNNLQRVRKTAFRLLPILLLVYILCLVNLKNGIFFTVSPDNVYQRGRLFMIPYLVVFFDYFYTLCLNDISRKSGLHLRTMSPLAFVGPCIVGTVLQGMFYGITLGWTSAAIALVHIYQQTQFLNFYTDSLSALYNRRYLERVLERIARNQTAGVYGIMIDVNDFKHINDAYGHVAGDRAVRHIARILSQSISAESLAVRYAGDEFVLLLRSAEPTSILALIRQVEQNVASWNESKQEPFTLSFAMGYSCFDPARMTPEEFLADMDRHMYENKRQHYQSHERMGLRETDTTG